MRITVIMLVLAISLKSITQKKKAQTLVARVVKPLIVIILALMLKTVNISVPLILKEKILSLK